MKTDKKKNRQTEVLHKLRSVSNKEKEMGAICYPHLYDGGQVHQFTHLHVPSVTPRVRVHRCALLPLVFWQLAWSVLVLTIIVATVFTGTAGSPSVIGHNGILKA